MRKVRCLPFPIGNSKDDCPAQWQDKHQLIHPAGTCLNLERPHGSAFDCDRRREYATPQAGVIAYRIRRGEVQVLLMTSRDIGRWIIPKGNIKPSTTPSKAAAEEALEEAGIKGTVSSTALGIYSYSKKLGSGEARAATVEVFLLRVKKQVKKWPEKSERKLAWYRPRKQPAL
jgi:8-oxo-dGTP pyrophosphatase MutT (NUDIX family)